MRAAAAEDEASAGSAVCQRSPTKAPAAPAGRISNDGAVNYHDVRRASVASSIHDRGSYSSTQHCGRNSDPHGGVSSSGAAGGGAAVAAALAATREERRRAARGLFSRDSLRTRELPSTIFTKLNPELLSQPVSGPVPAGGRASVTTAAGSLFSLATADGADSKVEWYWYSDVFKLLITHLQVTVMKF